MRHFFAQTCECFCTKCGNCIICRTFFLKLGPLSAKICESLFRAEFFSPNSRRFLHETRKLLFMQNFFPRTRLIFCKYSRILVFCRISTLSLLFFSAQIAKSRFHAEFTSKTRQFLLHKTQKPHFVQNSAQSRREKGLRRGNKKEKRACGAEIKRGKGLASAGL